MRSLLLFASLGLIGCMDGEFGSSDRYQADFHYTYDLQPGGRINIESFNGSVEITGWDDNKVEVRGAKYASTEEMRDRIKIEARNSAESIDLRAIRPSGRFGNMGARFIVHVPRTAILDRISTSNGSIRVRDVASAAHLTTSNSRILAENLTGDLDARTSNGAIEVDNIGGALRLKTSNSHIHGENIEGPCDVITSNGDVELDFRKALRNDVVARTSNSGITVRLPAGSSARVDANTSNASVSSDFDFVGSMDEHKHHAEGVIGTGGPMIRLTTSNGRVRIARGNGG